MTKQAELELCYQQGVQAALTKVAQDNEGTNWGNVALGTAGAGALLGGGATAGVSGMMAGKGFQADLAREARKNVMSRDVLRSIEAQGPRSLSEFRIDPVKSRELLAKRENLINRWTTPEAIKKFKKVRNIGGAAAALGAGALGYSLFS